MCRIVPCTTTMMSHSTLLEMELTNSSPEATAASLNEMETCAAQRLKKLHKNTKYVYPFWKVCQVCCAVFPCLDRYQAERKRTCSSACAAHAISKSKRALPVKPIATRKGQYVECVVCGTEVWKYASQLKKVTEHFCSYRCNGIRRGESWRAHGSKGRAAWSPAATASAKEKMTGAGNPAWKGGVTTFRTHGNYAGVKYVRCPPSFIEMARRDGYVMEHRLIVAVHLGRCLPRSEVVHHNNHDPTDNRLENLMLFQTNRDHKAYEWHGKPEPLWSGLSLYLSKEQCGALPSKLEPL